MIDAMSTGNSEFSEAGLKHDDEEVQSLWETYATDPGRSDARGQALPENVGRQDRTSSPRPGA